MNDLTLVLGFFTFVGPILLGLGLYRMVWIDELPWRVGAVGVGGFITGVVVCVWAQIVSNFLKAVWPF